MKKSKRILALLLTLVLSIGMMPTNTFAAGLNWGWFGRDFWTPSWGNSSTVEETVEPEATVPEEVVEEAIVEETEPAVVYPAQAFAGSYDGVDVTVNAPEGALPEGTVMNVTAASDVAVQAAADLLNADVADVTAVDISFVKDGVEIEPEVAISVTMQNVAVVEEAVVVHVDDAAQAEIVESTVEGEAVTFEADEFSVYAIATPDNRTTVNFYYNGSIVNTQIIKGAETLYDPSSEVSLPEGTQFKGWHLNSTTGPVYTIDELNEQTFEPGTVNVYAETFRAYSVQYKDGDTLLKNEIVELEGSATSAAYTVNQAYEVSSQSETFVGWMVQGTDTVYANGTEISVTGNLVLVPKTAEGYWLTFNENGYGATYVSPVFVANGTSATAPAAPTRPGYTFAGWYTAAEGGSAYAFGTLSENTTVYAHWTMNARANYTVNYWLQKVTDDVNAANKTYDFKESETKTAASNSVITVNVTKSYKGFDLGSVETGAVVNPDGSTVVNVYFNRKVCTVNFKLYSTGTLTCTKTSWLHTHNDSCYTGRGWNVDSSVQGLYGADLAEGDWRTDHYWKAEYDGSSASGTGCVLLTSFDFITAGYESNSDNVKASDGTVITCNFYGTSTQSGKTIYYYNEQADGSFKLANTVTAGSGNLNLHEKYTGYDPYKYYLASSKSTIDFTKASNWTSRTSWKDGDQVNNTYVYIANKLQSFPLHYMVDGVEKHTETVKYTAPLTGYDAKYTPTIPEGQMFVGWFADTAGTVAFDFTTEKMPLNGTSVFAKFEPIQYRVFLNTNGGTLPEGQASDFRVDYGNVVQDSALQEPLFTKEDYTLIGWYTDEAMTSAYNFATHIDQSVIDAKGDNTYREDAHANVVGSLNLYAKWRKNPDATSTFKVEYDAADGTNAPVDETPYNEGATATVSTGSTAPSGLVFDHWVLLNADGSESGYTYGPGETFAIDSAYSVEEDGKYVITLKAVYAEKHSTFLKYDTNGGGEFVAGTVTEITDLEINSDVTLLTAAAINASTGYEFLGWNQNKAAADAGVVEFQAGQTVAVDNMTDAANTLYAVWAKFFFVYHSSTAQTTKHAVVPSFDITAQVASGYLYGGYYNNCKKIGTIYKGAVSGYWSSADACTEYGKTMAPVAGKTYYLKEVPAGYLKPSMAVVYNTYRSNQVEKLYLMSVIDDKNYADFGIEAIDTITEEKVYASSFKVTNELTGNVDTYTAKSLANLNGLLGVWNATDKLTANNNFAYTPYYTTLDGVTVDVTTRTVYTGDVRYYGTLERTGNAGVSKEDVNH